MEPSTRKKPSWLSSPCVRQSDLLLILHHHLQRKHPQYLLPPFPRASRQDPSWGTDAYLQRNRRRLQRYFSRILARPELKEEVARHDFMTTKEEIIEPRKGLFYTLERWLKSGRHGEGIKNDQVNDRIIIYRPSHINLAEGVSQQETLDKSLTLRKSALKGVQVAANGAIQALQQYAESLGRISKCIHEVTATHVGHLREEPSNDYFYHYIEKGEIGSPRPNGKSPVSNEEYYRQRRRYESLRSTERRFRELGDRFIDLVNQLQPGLGEIATTIGNTVLEVLEDQQMEVGHVRSYANREIGSLKRYDQAAGRRHLVEGRIPRADAPSEVTTRHHQALNQAREEEDCRRMDYEEADENLRGEMRNYWTQSGDELFDAICESIRTSLEVGKVHIDALRAWFPPPDHQADGKVNNQSDESEAILNNDNDSREQLLMTTDDERI